MPIGFRIVTDVPRAPDALMDRFFDVPTAHLSDSMSRLFAGGADLRPMHRGGKLVGNALTVRTRPGDNLMVHKAIDMAKPRDVIVVDAGGELAQAIIGELMMRHAEKRGVAGFVIDGAIRDLGTIAAERYPVYAAGVTHRGPYKDGPGEINVPVTIGGMLVSPGDIVIGDDDGVVAIAPKDARAVAEATRKKAAAEAATLESIARKSYDDTWIEKTLKA